jgi:hypothetical protein
MERSRERQGGYHRCACGNDEQRRPALTIYDPLDESTLMPMTWHEGGIAFWGQTKLFHYQAGGYIYPTAPLKDTRLLGLALRGGITPVDGLDLSLSYFYGSSKEGMVQRFNPNLAEFSHIYHAAFDFAYINDNWTIDGQMTMSNCKRNKAVGIEAGYDVAGAMGLKSFSIIPFARYDGYFHVEGASCNKWTIGLNTSLPLGFTFKAEAGWENPPQHVTHDGAMSASGGKESSNGALAFHDFFFCIGSSRLNTTGTLKQSKDGIFFVTLHRK